MVIAFIFSQLVSKKLKTNLKKGGVGSRLGGGASPTPSQSSEKTLTEAEIAVSISRIMSISMMSICMLMSVSMISICMIMRRRMNMRRMAMCQW